MTLASMFVVTFIPIPSKAFGRTSSAGIKSTHAAVSKKHVQKYVDKFVVRYNNRHEPAEMFNRVLKQISKPKA